MMTMRLIMLLRTIADHIRMIDDVTTLARHKKAEGIVTSLDYKKAFDSIEKESILHMLNKFNFGPYFTRLVRTLISNTEASIQNGGWISGWFETVRGIRQGCCVSPMLFILVVELLAIKIRNANHINSILLKQDKNTLKIPKILSYADDMTLLLKGEEDLKTSLTIIEEFRKCSGLELNRSKCINMWIGTNANNSRAAGGIPTLRRGENMKVLGVYFNAFQEASSIEQNWENKMDQMIKLVRIWQRRNLSLYGKIIIAKTFLLSLWTHLIQSITLPSAVLKEIDSVIFRFLWQKKYTNKRAYEKVKRSVLCLPIQNGGLGMISMTDQQSVFHFKWIRKLWERNKEYKIANTFFSKFINLKYFVKCRPQTKSINTINIPSNFWCTVANSWQELHSCHLESCSSNLLARIFNGSRLQDLRS